MKYDLQDADLSTVLAEGRLVADETKRAFGRLSAESPLWSRWPGTRLQMSIKRAGRSTPPSKREPLNAAIWLWQLLERVRATIAAPPTQTSYASIRSSDRLGCAVATDQMET